MGEEKVLRDPFSLPRRESTSLAVPPWRSGGGARQQHCTITLTEEEHRFLEWMRKEITRQRRSTRSPRITRSAIVRAALALVMEAAPGLDLRDVRDEADLYRRVREALKG